MSYQQWKIVTHTDYILTQKIPEYIGAGPAQDFSLLAYSSRDRNGVWPFSCQKLIPCQDSPHQTCGCENGMDSENLAIVYNMKTGYSFKNWLQHENRLQQWFQLVTALKLITTWKQLTAFMVNKLQSGDYGWAITEFQLYQENGKKDQICW